MKMKKYSLGLAVLACMLSNYSLLAQNVTLKWGKSVGAGEDFTNCGIMTQRPALDGRNNIYSGGNIQSYPSGNVDFGGGLVVHDVGDDGFITKQDRQGNFIWVKHFPDLNPGTFSSSSWVQDIALDRDNNVYAIGSFYGDVVFDPGNVILSTMGQEIFIVKLDSAGGFLWARQFAQMTIGMASPFSMAVDSVGNVYVTGVFNGTVDFDPDPINVEPMSSMGVSDMFVCKLDSAGNYVWAKQIGGQAAGSSATGKAITLDPQGTNLYLTGAFSDEVEFNPAGGNLLITGGVADVFVMKMTSGGDFVWVKQFECTGAGAKIGNGIALDANTDVLVAGHFYGTIAFDAGTSFTAFGSSTYDMFVAKLDSAGNLTWAKHLGGNGYVTPNAIIADAFNNIYTTGTFFQGSVDFDPGPTPFDMTPARGNQNTFVSKLDQNGDFLYAFQLEGNNNAGAGLAASPGNVYLVGTFRDTIDLDPASAVSELRTVVDAGHIFFANYGDCPALDTSSAIQGPDTVCAGGSYTFRIPPVSGAVSYSWELPSGWSGSGTADSITVTTGTAGGDIKVVANGVCDSSTEQTFSVYVNLLSVSITVNGDTLTTDNAGNYTSWQWFLNGTAISQATGSSHIAVENGDYTVVVTDRYGCTDTSDIESITHFPESVRGLTSAAMIRIYPNPATRTAYIHTPIAVSVRLSTIEGKTVAQRMIPGGVRTAIDLSDLSAGVYLLNIADESGRLIRVEKLVRTAE